MGWTRGGYFQLSTSEPARRATQPTKTEQIEIPTRSASVQSSPAPNQPVDNRLPLVAQPDGEIATATAEQAEEIKSGKQGKKKTVVEKVKKIFTPEE